METIKKMMILISIFLLAACGAGEKTAAPAPSNALLILPAQNTPCFSGTNVTSIQSTVSFSWQKANNADSYTLNLKNLLTGSLQTKDVSGLQTDVTLSLNTPYSWYIVSKSNGSTQTAQSETWKFYNAGSGVKSFAPFPAELISPELGALITGNTVSLTWKGSDADNDISSYDIYLGTTSDPQIVKSKVLASTITLDVATNTTYYWKIVTTDAKNNTSTSELHHFTIN